MKSYKRVIVLGAVFVMLIATLPVFAAAVRARPQGPYSYVINYSNSFQGETESGRERGQLRSSGLRIVGSSNQGDTSFDLKLNNRLNRNARQNRTARGRVTIEHDEFGTNFGPATANVRYQHTRAGIWKITANYTGRMSKGQAKGATISGRVVAKSI